MTPLGRFIIYGLMSGLVFLYQPVSGFAEGVKTYYKQYSIFPFEGENYLCEPYLVKKDDWLYKIFRQKGEISASDFPRFLKIFKRINPKLNNIDAIAPGHQILIPLKRVEKQAYAREDQGMVEVPVLEFSLKPEERNLAKYIRKHEIKPGDTVSVLLGKEFLKKGGAISEVGKKTFTLLNPDITDVNRIYPGTQVLIPDPAILVQPWFDTFLSLGTPGKGQDLAAADQNRNQSSGISPRQILTPGDLSRLKRYTELIQGTLMHQGKMHFPDKKSNAHKTLDLSKTPVLEERDGKKTLVLPPDSRPLDFDPDLLAAIKAYWKDIRLQEINNTISRQRPAIQPLDRVPEKTQHLIKKLIAPTPYTYAPEERIPVVQNNINIPVTMGRITHPNVPDLLVNTGNVYGQVLDTIKTQGYDVLSLSSGLSAGELTLLLFSKLGYDTWKNPAFSSGTTVETLYGIYVKKEMEKYFIVNTRPSKRAGDFLAREGIKILVMEDLP